MKIIGIITSLFITIFLIINRSKPLLLNLADASFLLSLIYLMVAMVIYVRNIGLFKTFAYNSYKRTVRKDTKKEKNLEEDRKLDLKDQVNDKIEGIDPRNLDLLEFHEFCQQKYSVQWSTKAYLVSALALFILSSLISYFL